MKKSRLLCITGVCCILTGAGLAQDSKKEIRCYWMGSSSSPMRLVKTFDDFINAGQGYSTKGSVRGQTVRLDRLAVPGNTEKPLDFKGLNKGEFDYAIIQVSMGFVRDQQAIDGMGAIIADICMKVRERGAKPVFWEAYAATPDKETGQTVVQMQEKLHQELLKATVKNGALFVPAGSPWQEVRMTRPEDRLYMFSQVTPNDIGHTGPRGNFILGAAIYAAVTGENPVENQNLNTYEMDPSQDKNKLWGTSVPFGIDPIEGAQLKEVVRKHELKAREEYAALGGRVAPSESGRTAAPAAAAASATAAPAKESFDIYLVMGRQAVIVVPASFKGSDKKIFILDAQSGDWRPYRAETDGAGGLGAALAGRSPGKSIGLILCGADGSSMEDWSKERKQYNRAMTLAQDALRQGTLRGCIWASATEDADVKNPAYTKLINDFREEVPSPELPFVTAKEVMKAGGGAGF